MKIKGKQIVIFNLIAFILFIIPAFKLDLKNENYSTLSLNTRGYLYLLFLGIIIGTLLGYETYYISSKKYAIYMFLALLFGTLIPHHVPYNLQGNLHMLFAYVGFFTMCFITYLNIYKKAVKYLSIYSLVVFASILVYLLYGMVNTLSEIMVMFITMLVNMLLYLI